MAVLQSAAPVLDAVEPANAGAERLGRGYIALYVTAQIAAYLSFIPLLSILLPLAAARIGGADKADVLAMTVFWGSITALFANPIAGALSDRTRSRFGRRRPWVAVGVVGTVISYGVIAAADTPSALVAGFVLFQIMFNVFFAPLNALIPDRVPDAQKGLMSGLVGLGTPIGSVIGVLLIGQVVQDPVARFAVIGVIILAGALPFILLVPERAHVDPAPHADLGETLRAFWVNPRKHPDFAWAWLSRFLIMIPYSLVSGYMLYYLQEAVGYETLFPGHKAEEGLATLTVISTAFSVLSTLGGGYLSDRIGRRKIFVMAAGLVMALAIAIFAAFPTWPGMLVGYAVFGLGMGCFFAVDIALIAQVLPSRRDAGKHLGVFNLTNMFGQAVAPLLAVQVLKSTGGNYVVLFGAAAVIAVMGALGIQPMRKVR